MILIVAACRQSHTSHRVRFIRTLHASPRLHGPEDTVTTKRPRPTVTKKLFSELPKGRPLEFLAPPALSPEVTAQRVDNPVHSSAHYTQPRNNLATEILENLTRFPHCILLTRVGQFYESYFDQANEVARLLGIKLTSRIWNKQRVAMCVLVQQKRFVAMCEEFPRYISGQKPEFERRVVRVITPGTLIDEPFLNHFENNYLLSIIPADGESGVQGAGLAWIDVSTGEFFTKTTSLEELKDELARLGPREIVLAENLREQPSHPIRELIEDEGIFLSYIIPSITDEPLVSGDIILDQGSTASPTYTPQESGAINILATYLRANLLEHMPQLSTPSREGAEERMQIDSHTIKALEIRESTREGGTTGSLFNVIKRTVTSSGTRFLARRLCSPSTSVKEIEARQSLVTFFYDRPDLRDDIVRFLGDSDDASRIVQRFLLGRGEPKDLLAINRTIQVWTSIQERIELERKMEGSERGNTRDEDWSSIDALMSRITNLRHLSSRIALALQDVELAESAPDEPAEDDALVDEGKGAQTRLSDQSECATCSPSVIISANTISRRFSEQLTALHNTLNSLLDRRTALERDLRIQYNAPSLTLRTSPALAKIKIDPLFVIISESASTSSYFYQRWSQLGGQIVETTVAITNTEKEIFNTLRNEVKAFSSQLRRHARIMDELDVTLGFANLATELRFVRPVIKDDATYEVTNGRHPTVELGLLTSGRVFIPNSVALKPHSCLHVIITGPNMAGKSTFLRQTALIAILAQTGSFVPAEHAVIGVVDRLFSRVGAKDDLFRDRSTFMVEMLETAEILRRATPKSLVIMDEVGRGTTVKDGLAIAFATVHHLAVHNRCRALFATHFHELADLLAHAEEHHHGSGVFHKVGFFCTDVHETEDNFFTYSHRLRPGVNRDSHGLKVAQLAGMPKSAVHLAKDVLSALQGQQHMDPAQLTALGRGLTAG
ncbi:muts domain V-domain-containing protein [Melanogaster broomeanus]|nr:muts domain V-domain-containing protein [Melanogaster broomeanus]